MGRDTLWMNNLRRFMSYKRIPELAFDWKYDELMEMPLFMIHHIYEILDEFVEADKLKHNAMKSNFG